MEVQNKKLRHRSEFFVLDNRAAQLLVNSCFTIHKENNIVNIAVPIEVISAMNDISVSSQEN